MKTRVLVLLLTAVTLFSGWVADGAEAALVTPPASIKVPATDTDGRYKVTWTASPTPLATYVLEEATNSTFTANRRTAYKGPALTARITTRSSATTYYYRVKARKAGSSVGSAWRKGAKGCRVKFPTAAVPGSITVPASDTDGGYSLTWTASATPLATYVLEEATNTSFTANLRTTYSGPALTAPVISRANATTYYYRVKARKTGAFVDSGWRNGANGCAVTFPSVAIPDSITVPVIDSDGSYTVSWGVSATAGASYVLQEASSDTFADATTVYSGFNLSADFTGRAPGSTSFYRVKATKAGYTDSAWRSGSNSCLVPESDPVLTLMVATDTDKLQMAWLPGSYGSISADEINYELHLSTEEGFIPSALTLKKTVTGASQTQIAGLETDTRYYGVVIATFADDSRSNPSNVLQTKTYKDPALLDPFTVVSDAAVLGMGTFTTTDESTYVFPNASGDLPAVNSVLFAEQSGGGMTLRRVDAADNSGGIVTVNTSPASLTDVFDRASIFSSFHLADLQNQAAGLKGVRGSAAGTQMTTSDGSLYSRVDWKDRLLSVEQTTFAYHEPDLIVEPQGKGSVIKLISANAVEESFTATVTAIFEPTLITEAEWGGIVVKTLDSAKVAATGTMTLEVAAAYHFAASGTAEKTFELYKKNWTSIYPLGATGLLVYQEITETINVVATASASAKIDARASASISETIEFGATYDGSTWTPYIVHSEGQNLTAALDIVGGASGEIRLIPEVKVTFYKVLSSTLSSEPFVKSSLAFEETTNNPAFLLAHPLRLIQATSFDASLGIECNVAVNLSGLGMSWDVLPKTCVLGSGSCKYAFPEIPLFSLPVLDLTDTTPDATDEKTLQLQITDGTHNAFNSGSVQWEVFPNDATIQPGSCNKSGEVTTCTATFTPGAEEEYTVFASGYGVLGEVGRQFKELTPGGGCGTPVMRDGREWQRCGSDTFMSWNAAIDYCEALDEGGHSDWILPTIEQLRSLIVCTNGTVVTGGYPDWQSPSWCGDGNSAPYDVPTIDRAFSSIANGYWSSTSVAYDPNSAWVVGFSGGYVDYGSKDGAGYVRCVRGGQ